MEPPSIDPSPLERIISQEDEEITWRALSRIPARYRLPLVLFYRENKSVEAVARTLDLTEDNVRKRITRGKRMLQDRVTAMIEFALTRLPPKSEFAAGVLLALGIGGGAKAAQAAERAGSAIRGRGGRAILLGGAAAVMGVLLVALVAPTRNQPGAGVASNTLATEASAPATTPAARPGRNLNSAAIAGPAGRAPGERMRLGVDVPNLRPPVVRRRVLDADFEDGKSPSHGAVGGAASCPPRAGSTHCLVAEYSGTYLMAGFGGGRDGVLRHSKSATVAFDYWVAQPGKISVQISDGDQQPMTHYLRAGDATPGTWTHVDLMLDDAAPVPGGRPMDEGDRIVSFRFVTKATEGQALFIDNVVISE
jgi:hypothetical protein